MRESPSYLMHSCDGMEIDVCTKPKVHGGLQRILCNSGKVDLYFDGKLTWFLHQSPTKKDMENPPLQLTDQRKYTPELFVQEVLKNEPNPTPTSTKDAGTVVPPPEECFVHDYSLHDDLFPTHSSRRRFIWEPERHNWKPHQLVEWKRRLCASSEEIVKTTFLATTQLVPSVQHENEAYPKDHHAAQFPILSHQQLKETIYADPVEYKVNGSTEYALFVACRE
jgi:hypothetical protein